MARLPASMLVTILVLPWAAWPSAARAADVDPIASRVRPLLAKHCTSCHDADGPEGGADLSLLTDERSVERHPDVAADAISQLRGHTMPPASRKARPTEAERTLLVRELAAALDRSDARRPPYAGPAPLRRLNRVEYRNAVRDLLGVDVEVPVEFPADDVAHGFDNVADGLSLSPTLLERYLSAAEAVLGVLAEGRGERVEAEAAGACLDGVKPGWVDAFAAVIPMEAEAGASIGLPQAGEYEVVARVSRDGPGEHPATLALRVDGVDVKAWSVYAPPARPAELSMTLRMPEGRRRFTLRHTWHTAQTDKDPPTPGLRLRLESLVVRGPLPRLAHGRVFSVRPGDGVSEREAAAGVLERFAGRAFRRPLDAGEVDRLLPLYDRARAGGRSHEAATRVALASVLVSPHFLFHVLRPDDAHDAHGNVPLGDWQLAARLSFFLWSAPPDDELRELARAGRLREEAVLRAQVRRMLADPRASALAENFAEQWLGVRRLATIPFDRATFPQFNDGLRRAMAEEARLLFRTILEEDRGALEFLAADWTWMNEDLARLYGQRGVRGGHMRRVTLSDPNRGGLLTMPAVLAVTSHPTRTSAVKRGKWLLDEILGAPPPPPPPDVPELEAAAAAHAAAGGRPLTYRERMERHRADPRCAGCHVRMDTLGLGLENFDAIGRWRDRDAGRPIDAAGTLPDGATFRDPAELRRVLLDRRDDFLRCLTEKLFVYALGRGVQREDRREIQRIVRTLAASDARLSTLVGEVVLSYPFRHRQIEPPPQQQQRKE